MLKRERDVFGHVRRAAGRLHHERCTDPELLRQFVLDRDEAAFAALVRRHGPMVMRVCRHVLHHEQEAEDAFQVTFLVLARNPSAIRKVGSLASWLHGVAYRTALTARRSAATRRRHEARRETMSRGDTNQELAWREVQDILVEEVHALPETYRAPFVLCQIEGRSRGEAARELGIKEGTVSSRLDGAQKYLRERLGARGVALAAGLAAVGVASSDGVAAVPGRLVEATIRAGVAQASGGLTSGAISASAEELLRAVTRALGVTPGKIATTLLAAVLLFAGVGMVPAFLLGQQKGEEAAQGERRAASAGKVLAPAAGKPGRAAPLEMAKDTGTVSGKVLGPDSKPFAGAEVVVRWGRIGVEAASPGPRTTSGPDGKFRLSYRRSALGKPPLAPDVDPYHFSPLQVVAGAKGHGPGWAYVHIQRGASGEGLTLRLVKEVVLQGRVRDIQLRPVTDATVRVLLIDDEPVHSLPGLARRVTTDKEGRFVLTGIGRDRKARVAITGPTIERKVIDVSTTKGGGATVEVVARPTRVLEGTIRAADTGKPLAGVVVRGGPQWGLYTDIHAVTDARGRYRLVGLPKGGSYEVTAWPSRGQPFLPKTATVPDRLGLAPITVGFRLERGVALRVRLVDKGTGLPVRGVAHYDPLANNPSRVGLLENANGRLPLWQFRVFYPDKNGYCHLVAPAGPGAVLGRGHDVPYLTRPIAPADVKTYPFLAKTGYTVGGLGHYWELFQSYRVIDAKVGERPLDVDIELDPGRKVEGRLVGPDGRPVHGAVAFGLDHAPQKVNNYSYRNDPIYRAHVESRALDTDRFVALGLTDDGARTVTFLHSGRKLIANVVVRAKHKGPLTVRLEPWGSAAGRLVDQNGKPVPGADVELLYPSQESIGLLMPGTAGVAPGLLAPGRPFRTDALGRFRVEGLIPGQKHRLTFRGVTVFANLAAKTGEARDLGDVRVNVKERQR
jgi:RNA polymerase sigma factor (sigma-70 family)